MSLSDRLLVDSPYETCFADLFYLKVERMNHVARCLLSCAGFLAVTAIVCADDSPVKTLTADQQAAMDSIEESKVLETVSFLASDEMAGRNTPSPELDIAADYVAKRFRSAGLEGLGAEGSFFQPAQLSLHADFFLPPHHHRLAA